MKSQIYRILLTELLVGAYYRSIKDPKWTKEMKRNPSSLPLVSKNTILIHNWSSCQHKLRKK